MFLDGRTAKTLSSTSSKTWRLPWNSRPWVRSSPVT